MATPHLIAEMAKVAMAGQTALITGGSAGIGAAIATILRRADVNLILTGRSQDKLAAFVKNLPQGKGSVHTYAFDVSDREQTDRVIRQTVQECPPIDFLLNNAGFALGSSKPFWEQDPADVDAVMGTNVNGVFNITTAVLKHHMMTRTPHPKGTILNLSSITGHQAPMKEMYETSYHTSKAAIEGFSNVLRHELVGTNIRVLVFRPGTVNTEFHARRHGYDEKATAATYEGTAELQAEDVAQSIVWQLLQPERVSVVLMEVLPSAQRSLYVIDRDWVHRNT